jgi:hypothetical protein
MINHGTLLGVTGGIYLANKRQANALHTSPLSGCDADQFVKSHQSSLSDLAEHGVEKYTPSLKTYRGMYINMANARNVLPL